MLEQISYLTAVGINLETKQTDLKVKFALDDAGDRTDLDHTFGRIIDGTSTAQGLVETNDEIAYTHDAPPLTEDGKPVLEQMRDVLGDIPRQRVPDGHTGKFTLLNAATLTNFAVP